MANGVLIGAACGIGAGVLVGIVCCLIFVYFKKKNDRRKRSRKKSSSFPPRGPNIIQPKPTFIIPPLVPIPLQPALREMKPDFQLSPPPASPALSEGSGRSSPGGSLRRCSVQLDDILTIDKIDIPPKRKKSPAAIGGTNEPAIANLYITQKRRMGKKKHLKKVEESRKSSNEHEWSLFGELEFTLFYNQLMQELQIYIMRAIQVYIPGVELPLNLAVKAVILVNNQTVWQDKTATAKASNEPDFSEYLIVPGLPAKKMRECSLRLVVMDDNTSQAAGEVVYPLSSLPINQFTTETLKLTEVEDAEFGEENQATAHEQYLGKLLISMCLHRNELSVGVECAEGLPCEEGTEVSSFVKVAVMCAGKKLHSCSTKVVNKTRNPDYNEVFDFFIPDDKLPQVTIYFKVFRHRGKMKRDGLIGMVILGNRHGHDAEHETEYRHFEQVVGRPHLCINYWHVIRKHR